MAPQCGDDRDLGVFGRLSGQLTRSVHASGVTRRALLVGEHLAAVGDASSGIDQLAHPKVAEQFAHFVLREHGRGLQHAGGMVPHIYRDVRQSQVVQAVIERPNIVAVVWLVA